MKCQYLQDKFKIIDENIKKTKTSVNDPHLASMLSDYLVVFISGIYEDIIEYLFVQRVGKTKDKEIENLVKTLIGRQFRNPEFGKVKKLVDALDSKYGIELSKLDKKHRDAIDSIVSNKNKVAHGGVSNATINDVAIYHNNALKIFEELENILL